MAAKTFGATPNNDRSHAVTVDTADAIGTNTAAIIVDDTATKLEVMDAIRACLRAINRKNLKFQSPADYGTANSVE